MKFLRKTGFLGFAAFLLVAGLGCGDQYRPVANPIISGGGQPTSTHYAYVVNSNGGGPGSTTQIDVSGDTNVGVTSLGVGSVSEAFPPNSDELFIANSGNDSVSEYLPIFTGGAITTIALLPGSNPVFVSSAQAGFMYVINSGTNSACPNTGSISTIPTTTLSVTSTVCVGKNPTAMVQAPVSNVIYVLNQGDSSISVYTPGAGVSSTITSANGLGANPVSLTASTDGNWVFVVTQGAAGSPGALDIISAGSGTVGASVPLGMMPTFSVIDPTLNRLYVTNNGDNTVSVFDATNVNLTASPAMPTLATVSVGMGPIGVTALVDGTKFYVANAGSDNVTVVSASSYSVLGTVALATGADPVWIASDPTASRVYVANQGTMNTTIIQTSNNTITLNIAAPPQVAGCTASCGLQQPVMIVTQ